MVLLHYELKPSRRMRENVFSKALVESHSFPLYSSAVLQTLASFSVSLIFHTVGRIPWTGDQPVTRLLSARRTTQTQNKHTQTSMPRVGFEPKIPAFERAKTVHVFDCAATVIGFESDYI
jgi:hypothetical protein